MNSNDIGIADSRNRLREKAQNEATCFALNDMLKDAQEEVRRLREELAEWKSAAGVAGLTVGVLKEENDRLKYATPVNPSDVTNT